MSIKSVLAKDRKLIAKCKSLDKLIDAVRLMANEKVNALVVVTSEGRLVGIVTDQDIIRGIAERGGELKDTYVSQLMTFNVICCSPSTKLTDALKLMGQHRIRHLVVVRGDQPIAVVGVREILSKVHEHEEMEINVLRDMAAASLVAAV